MKTEVFLISEVDNYPTWASTENGLHAPIRQIMLKNMTEDPVVDEIYTVVYGKDALQHYELGDYVLASFEIFVGYNDDESYKQVIRVWDLKKINLPKNS